MLELFKTDQFDRYGKIRGKYKKIYIMDGEAIDNAEAVLVEENVDWFLSLWKQSEEQVQSPKDLLSFLLHCFMLELGFQGQEHSRRLPSSWKGPVGHVSRYSLEQNEMKSNIILTVTTLGHIVKVHGTHTALKISFSTSKLKPDDYITVQDEVQGKCKLITKNLRTLARVFKNEVGVPLLNATRSHLGLPVSGFQGLPDELSLRILHLLPLHSLISVTAVCKHFNRLGCDSSIWKKLFITHFGRSCSEDAENRNNWFKRFKTIYMARKERSRLQQQNLPQPPLFPFPDPGYGGPLNPLGPPVPGILGGEYDRFPGGGGVVPLFGGHSLDPSNFLPRVRFDPPGPSFPRRGGMNPFGPPGGFGGGFL